MCAPAGQRYPTVDSHHFKHVVGHLASGVTVITATDAGASYGMTASSVTSLSADPALMAACLNNAGPTAAAVASSGRYVVNVLGESNSELARRFATPSTDKFEGVELRHGILQVPLLADALAHIECDVIDRVVAGTHSIFVGRVVAASARQGRPLTYFRGGFGRFALAEEDAAYRDARELVLRRSYAMGGVIRVDGLAATLGVEEASAYYALTKLAAEGLVYRKAGLGYVVTPFDRHISDATFDARLVIELGVIDQLTSTSAGGGGSFAALRQRFEEMSECIRDNRFLDFEGYLEANYRFHGALIALVSNPLLTTLFDGLAIKQVMMHSFGATLETSQMFIDSQRQLLEAVEAGDKIAARDAARVYSRMAKERAREVLVSHGGSL